MSVSRSQCLGIRCLFILSYLHMLSQVVSINTITCCLVDGTVRSDRSLCRSSLETSAHFRGVFDCFVACLRDPSCHTYEYESATANCSLGYDLVLDCYSYLVRGLLSTNFILYTIHQQNRPAVPYNRCGSCRRDGSNTPSLVQAFLFIYLTFGF